MKTLWIGCSHSAGTYDINDKNINQYGIPNVVGKSFDYDNWKIVACPGHGIIEFSNIVTELYYNDLLNFDNIIIQLTTEPRLIGLEKDHERLKYRQLFKYIQNDTHRPKGNSIYRLDSDISHPYDFKMAFNMHPVSLYELYKDSFPENRSYKIDNALVQMTQSIYESLSGVLVPTMRQSYKNIVDICTKENINLYTFSYVYGETFSGQLYRYLPKKFNYKKYDILDGKGLYETSTVAERKHYYHPENHHPMEGAVINKSKVIIDALKEHGFKG